MTRLVVDIGGTNTRAALAEGPRIVEDSVRRYRNDGFAGLSAVLMRYLAEAGSPQIDGACAALAGPVQAGRGRLTNLDWLIDEAEIARVTGADRVRLLNDLQAQGHALDQLAPVALVPVLDGPRAPGGVRLVIGLGTGVNVTVVHRTGTGTLVTANEAGHVSLPVACEDDLSLARFAAGEDGFAAVEDVLAGRGLATLHAWVTSRTGPPQRIEGSEIIAAAPGDPAAEEALRTYATMLGRVAGDLALHHLPYGGIYLIGGVARAMTPHLARLGLADSFRAKGRFSGLMESFAIATITDDFAALRGCAAHLAETA
ncbi:glucokinase [Rhodovulum strictum]|uniref:ROK family protein n=1 Tax=Rhodovulum strictum TaxID=58314 RepID=A0A844BMY7_9RHOB|nr:glucokinase [Rhodovulum strictum]MRH22303.1 ROK family protein [Rhodovulum strictum]